MQSGLILLVFVMAVISISHVIHNINLLNPLFKNAEAFVHSERLDINDNIGNITVETSDTKFKSTPTNVDKDDNPLLYSLVGNMGYLCSKKAPVSYTGYNRLCYTLGKDKYLLVDQDKKFESYKYNALNRIILRLSGK
jgi:hypothetical protein